MADSNFKKRRCTNCGAYLEDNEKVCYVCGEIQIPDVVMSERSAKDSTGQPSLIFEEDKDFVVSNKKRRSVGTSEQSFNGDDAAELFYDDGRRDHKKTDYSEEVVEPYHKESRRETAKKKRTKKVAVICTVCVLVTALIAGAVCFCYYNGWFGGKKPNSDNKITIYFDRPTSDIDLITKDSAVYHWSGDVEVCYTVKDKEKTKECSPYLEHKTLWKVTLPAGAKSIYFYQSSNKIVRTQVLPSFTDDTVYYVSQTVFNAQNQLSVGECVRESFEGIGVNYATSEPVSETEASSADESESSTDEFPTETEPTFSSESGASAYTVSLPESWKKAVTAIEKGNCVSYYEDYNHDMYDMGMLVSIYVFDADDKKADELEKPSKTFYSSDGKKKIVVTTPTDIQFNDADEEAFGYYQTVKNDLSAFIASVQAN